MFSKVEIASFISSLIQKVREIAKEYPDTNYISPDGGNCYYYSGEAGGGCGCLIGQALQALPSSQLYDDAS